MIYKDTMKKIIYLSNNTKPINIKPDINTQLINQTPQSSPLTFLNEAGNVATFNSVNEYLSDNDPNKYKESNPKEYYKSDTDESIIDDSIIDYTSEYDSDIKINLKSETIIGKKTKIELIQKILPSIIIATGTGLAMMPVFNHLVKNSEQFGIDIHTNKIAFDLSTANTFIVASFSSFSSIYHFIQKYQKQMVPESKNISVSLSKIGASCSLVLPLGLLWGIELQNQKVANSGGFDEFLAWATFTTAPLIVDRIVESVQTVNNLYENRNTIDLNSVGSKLVVHGLAGLSLIGRALAYTEAAQTLGLAMGMHPEFALATGIIAGGVLGSSGIGLFEYNAVKSLFAEQKESMTIRKTLCGAISVIEGAWFTLPIISLGFQFAENWNPLLKGVLFTPLFVSHTVLESTKIYDHVMMSYDTISEGISSLGCCESYTDLEIS